MFTVAQMVEFHSNGIRCKCGEPAAAHAWAPPGNELFGEYKKCAQFIPETNDGIEVTAKGGKHSKIKTALTLIPPKALLEVGAVLKPAADKYGIDNWRGIDRRAHLDHALQHIFAYLAGEDTGEPDLVNATCRLLFAIECE